MRIVALLLLSACAFAADPKLTGGNGTLWLGGFNHSVLMIDEATEKVAGEIKTRTGIPRNLHLSQDRKRFYLSNAEMESIEVADIASRQVIDSFKLSEGNKKVRIRGFVVDPHHRYMILVAKAATKLPDRFEIGPNELLQYDLKEHKVMRKVPWPKNEEREFASMLLSPDGGLLYFMGEDIVIYDTKDFKEVDKWELSRPYEDGLGRINFGALDNNNEEPGYFTGIFQVQDAVQNRRIMGVARVNMMDKKVDFWALGPATGMSFALAPGRQWGYGLHQEVGRYEFWTFDLANHRLQNRAEFQGRPRMGLKVSSNGKLLYLHVAGNTIDLYEAATYKYLRTITLDTDMTTELHVMAGK